MKKKSSSRTVKYFTKQLLVIAARNADKWDFNRQLDLNAIQALPEARFPVSLFFPHYHRHGKPAEKHVRAMVVMDAQGGLALVDVPLAFWKSLPQAKIAA